MTCSLFLSVSLWEKKVLCYLLIKTMCASCRFRSHLLALVNELSLFLWLHNQPASINLFCHWPAADIIHIHLPHRSHTILISTFKGLPCIGFGLICVNVDAL